MDKHITIYLGHYTELRPRVSRGKSWKAFIIIGSTLKNKDQHGRFCSLESKEATNVYAIMHSCTNTGPAQTLALLNAYLRQSPGLLYIPE